MFSISQILIDTRTGKVTNLCGWTMGYSFNFILAIAGPFLLCGSAMCGNLVGTQTVTVLDLCTVIK